MNTDIIQEYYDSFSLHITDLKVFLNKDEPLNHLLKPIDLTLDLHNSIFPNERFLPTIGLEARLPTVNLTIIISVITII
eukprot:UN15377